MKYRPEVSVIMNCFNGERYLEDALNSLLLQKYNKWELIFFDNHSNDNSKKIFLKIKDKRFKYYKSKKKINLYQARNEAINYAKGKYITFLDVDDIWLNNKLQEQVKLIKEKKAKFIFTNYYLLLNNKKKIFSKKKLPEGFITQNLIDKYYVGILTVLFEKKLLQYYKLKFDSNYNIIGDFDLFLKLSKKTYFNYIHEPLAIYRYHLNNYSKLNNKDFNKEMIFWYKKNFKYFKFYNFSNFFLELDYLKIKSYIYNNNFIKAALKFFKYPFGVKKLKLLLFFILPNKYINF